ncbi:hypothetical protein DKX38_025887 [Salix brachista]|uniref:Translation initiation factor beta propellor-like domain-containing protein n=1 Tax=Salix brachista TaxID=2182728 RepID=A0A5N5JQ96_9ROSI|nr:hypothetical protein DKX38_025887 [Salix brachista]
MDLLCNAYSNSSDEEPEPKFKPNYKPVIPPHPKRFKPETPSQNLRTEAPVPGRYISKRERALSAQLSQVPNPAPTPNLNPNPTVVTSPVLGSISDSEIPPDVLSSLRQAKGRASLSQIPQRLAVDLRSHTKAVNALDWSRSHAHLLASAGMDQTVCVWNVWSRDQKIARLFKYHNAAVKDVKWSPHGLSVLSCGYDCSSRLIDVEKGIETQIFKEDQVVGVIKFCPDNSNIFLSGGSKGCLRLWDIRNGKVVCEYVRGLGPILDVEFTINGKQFISSSDVSGSNVSENSIIIWDISRQVPLSNQHALRICFKARYDTFGLHAMSSFSGLYFVVYYHVHMYFARGVPLVWGILNAYALKYYVSQNNTLVQNLTFWDAWSEAKAPSQVPYPLPVYVEAYTCPSVRCHPFEPCFVAQSNANYIAIFSSSPPFRLDKYRRYESHGVSGFPIKCNFSLDGEKLVSGSSDGSIYIYNYRSSELVRKIKVYEQACIDVVYHPVLPNVIASCSWNGDVSIFE